MLLSELKSILKEDPSMRFHLPNGDRVPAHYHVTEVGKIDKHFIDCGGTVRQEAKVNFQLWTAMDYHHRLESEKLLNIIELSETKLGITDAEIEVEYQGTTIGKYGLEYVDGKFRLTNTKTDCLAKDNCGIPAAQLVEKVKECCTPGSGCC